MARTLTPVDAYQLINALVVQATGQDSMQATDLSSFISAGELILSTGMENVFNAINIVLGRLIIASRPYKGRLNMMTAENSDIYTSRLRKVSFYADGADPAGNFNTDLFTNFAQGFTAGENVSGGSAQSTKSQWEQHHPIPLEMNFGGASVWQDCITLTEDAVKYAFRGPDEFNRFVAGYLQEHANDIESQKEAWNRAGLLNKIAGTFNYANSNQLINLTAAYNSRFNQGGTPYTTAELTSTYLSEFLKFFVSTFKLASEFLTQRTALYNNAPVYTDANSIDHYILRHTPYRDQRVYLYSPLFTEAEAWVMPEIFRPGYLDINTQYEPVTYWQSLDNRAGISVTPAITDLDSTSPTYGTQIQGSAVSEDMIVGVIMDRDALMTSFDLQRVDTTALEARKHYRNTWLSMAKNICDDPTEQCVVFYMADPATP